MREELHEKEWKTLASRFHREGKDYGGAISFMRMLALMYEITCFIHREVDSVSEEVVDLMKEDNCVTKMMLSSIQGAIAARKLGQCPRVRNIEPSVIKEYFQAIEANR